MKIDNEVPSYLKHSKEEKKELLKGRKKGVGAKLRALMKIKK